MDKAAWRRIGKILTWLLIFPPIGLWYLWKDPVLSRSTKGRVLLYGCGGLIALTLAVSALEIHLFKRSLADSGVDF